MNAAPSNEGDQVGDRQPEAGDVDHAVRRGAGDEREDQPADRVVDDARREDDEADVPLGEIEVDQDLGDHRHRRDRHRGGEEEAEQDPVTAGRSGTRPA